MPRHVIVSKFAPLGDAASTSGTPRDANGDDSSLKITMVPPPSSAELLDFNPAVGLICVDRSDGGRNQRQQLRKREDRREVLKSLPWMCLYTHAYAILLSVG